MTIHVAQVARALRGMLNSSQTSVHTTLSALI